MLTDRTNENLLPTSPLRHGTDDREAHPKKWLIALVQVNCERRISRQLSRLNIENFVAVQREMHLWSDRRRLIDRVVIPTAVFLRVDEAQQRSARMLPYIRRLMCYPGESKPASIPAEQVEHFRRMLGCTEAQVGIEQPPLSVGEHVIVTKGSLRGLCGELTRTTDNKSHVIIRIGCLGCACIDLPSECVERVPARR